MNTEELNERLNLVDGILCKMEDHIDSVTPIKPEDDFHRWDQYVAGYIRGLNEIFGLLRDHRENLKSGRDEWSNKVFDRY